MSSVNSRTTKPSACSSLRRRASLARSASDAVAAPSGHLGQYGLRFEAEVDPSQRRAVPPEDPLAGGPRQSRSPDEGQEAPLEVAVAAGVRHQLVQQPDAGPPGTAQPPKLAAQERGRGQAIPYRAVDGPLQLAWPSPTQPGR